MLFSCQKQAHCQLVVNNFKKTGERRQASNAVPDVIDLLKDDNNQPVSVSMANGKEQPLYRLIVGMIEE